MMHVNKKHVYSTILSSKISKNMEILNNKGIIPDFQPKRILNLKNKHKCVPPNNNPLAYRNTARNNYRNNPRYTHQPHNLINNRLFIQNTKHS